MGLVVLDEPWPAELGASLLRVFALAATIAGIVMLNWKGLDWKGLDWKGLDWQGLNWKGLDWKGLRWKGLNWKGLSWKGLRWSQVGGGEGGSTVLLEAGELRSDGDGAARPRGFEVRFTLPFTREEVWSELSNPSQPLGVSVGRVTTTAGGEAPAQDRQGGGGAAAGPLAVGSMRKAEFARGLLRGHVLCELLEIEPPERLCWAQRESDGTLSLVRDAADPQLSIELCGLRDGTEVCLTYEFERIALKAPLCLFGPIAPRMLRLILARTLPAEWRIEMGQRGYVESVAESAGGTPVGQQATRSSRQRKSDQDEEAVTKQHSELVAFTDPVKAAKIAELEAFADPAKAAKIAELEAFADPVKAVKIAELEAFADPTKAAKIAKLATFADPAQAAKIAELAAFADPVKAAKIAELEAFADPEKAAKMAAKKAEAEVFADPVKAAKIAELKAFAA